MSGAAYHRAGDTPARVFWSLTSIALCATLGVARVLRPDPHGLGTHLQLGLPRCGFLVLTGLPCPSCGLTTAFAHMARLDLVGAVHSNVVGVPLFLCVLCAIPYCVVASLRAWPVEAALKGLQVTPVAVIIGLTAVLSWLAKVAAIR